MTYTHPIHAQGLTLEYGDEPVLRSLDWTVPEGTATGLIGRNGAGKSTLLHTALGLLIPSGGECLTLGQDSRRLDDDALARIGFVDQQARLMEWLTVAEQLQYVALLRPDWDVDLEQQLLEEFDLASDRKKKISTLSGGEWQRLAVLVALCHRPKLILLDEPVSNQDPIFRGVVLNAVRERTIQDGATVVLSSHVLRDIESMVDRITMLNNGRVGTNEDLDTLKEQHQEWVIVGAGPKGQVVATEPYVVHSERTAGTLRLWVRAGESERREFERAHGVSVEARSVALEQLFPLLMDPPMESSKGEPSAEKPDEVSL